MELRPSGTLTSNTVGWNLASKRADRSWTAPAVVSLVNSALNASLAPTDDHFDLFADALWSCFYAESQRMTHPSSSRRLTGDTLIREIERNIELHASDPDFSVDLLAKHLGFTPRHIVNVLTAKGLPSPGKLIRAQRLRTALQLLEEQAVSETRITMDELARWSGFGSRTSLRRALEAQETP
ncbi:hypothetical protein [Rathayibacter sp. VKM Ac-2630]|uniref:hypothetical protein n=1 Tax=Rathayibacter sp. VKM Ac-2630 TaxID=1938617 RepID=UPI001300E11F|nr:hypothetical protein [Rathayibacter sp. VKM Ac-2630]